MKCSHPQSIPRVAVTVFLVLWPVAAPSGHRGEVVRHSFHPVPTIPKLLAQLFPIGSKTDVAEKTLEVRCSAWFQPTLRFTMRNCVSRVVPPPVQVYHTLWFARRSTFIILHSLPSQHGVSNVRIWFPRRKAVRKVANMQSVYIKPLLQSWRTHLCPRSSPCISIGLGIGKVIRKCFQPISRRDRTRFIVRK